MGRMKLRRILMIISPFIKEVNNDDALITDTEESGSGRIGALTDESEDADDLLDYGVYHRVFNKTPPRAPCMLNQTAETQAQVESPGAEEDVIEEPPQLRRCVRLNQIQQRATFPREVRDLDTECNRALHQHEAHSIDYPFYVCASLTSDGGEPTNMKEALSGLDR
jgi:hypothetical protein